MKVIRISEEVWEILKIFARPLEDNPDSVLKRILNEYIDLKNMETPKIKDGSINKGEPDMKFDRLTRGTASKRAVSPSKQWPRQNTLPYVRMVCSSLASLGGRAYTQEVIRRIENDFSHLFTEQDRRDIESGETRWVKRVNWARYDMVQGGLLRDDSPRGIWELTEEGKNYNKKAS